MTPRLRFVLLELRYWLFPGGLLVGAAVLWLHLEPGSDLLARVVDGYPWAVYGAGLLLAWRLRRSRVAAGLLALMAAHEGVAALPAELHEAGVASARLLIPFLLLLVAVFHDRPVLSRKGLAPTVVVLGVAAVATLGLRWIPERLGGWATATIPIPDTPWSVPVALLGPAVAGGGLLILTLVRRGAVERALLWCLAASLLALAAGPDTTGGRLHHLAAGLILATAVVESSYLMAFHDELTGLPGRRALNQELDRLGKRYTLAMVDVDHFKRFNDRHGHEVGDQVLRMVAGRLRRAPGGGRAFRYGGEEFTLLYAGTPKAEAMEYLERVRESVADAEFHLRGPGRLQRGKKGRGNKDGGKALSVTVSVGVAEPARSDESPEDVLERADQALYRAKKKGRDRLEG